jgi:cytochrome c
MNSFEFNKIFAAILVAGIVAYLAAFVGNHVIVPEKLEKNAVEVEGGPVDGGGAAAGPKGPEPIMHLLAAADVAQGEKLSKACAACHSFDNGGPNKVGPNLWNVVNIKKGAHAGFAYSDALMAKGGTWSYDSLNKFLYKPKAYIDGTAMNYVGLKKPEDRAAIIAWLRTIAPSPAALPSEAEMAAEKAELAPEPVAAPVEAAAPAEAGAALAEPAKPAEPAKVDAPKAEH